MTVTRCGAKKRRGGKCTLVAGWGTDHPGAGRCRLHGGSSPTGRKAAQREMAERAVQVYGAPCVGSDPHVALGELLDLSRGHVKWLAGVIAAFSDSAQLKQYAGSEDGLLWERPSVWVDLYDRERRHLESIAKTCAAVGVEERRIQLAEGQGALIAQAIQGVLTEVGVVLSPEVRGIVRRHLLAVSAGTVEGTAGDA